MRIGIDARMYGAESTTGIGVYIHRLTDEIFNVDRKNEYYLFMSEPVFSQFKSPHDQIKKIRADIAWYSWSEQIEFPKLLNKYHLDLVHFPHFNAPIFYRRNFVVTIHDLTPKFFPGPKVKKSFYRKLAYHQVFSHALKKSRKIITISHYTEKNILNYYPNLGSKITVAYPGISQDFRIIADKNLLVDLKNKYSIKKPFIFYVGVWRDHKNITGLISAFGIIKKNSLDYQLVLGGVADERYPEILQAINNCPYKDDVILPGFISKNELPLFYNAASLFVLPSFSEGFGLVAVEAVACGTPVVASKTTSVPEVLGNTALYFDPYNNQEIAAIMGQVLQDDKLAKDLVANGQDIIKQYNWQDCAKKTLEVYRSCM